MPLAPASSARKLVHTRTIEVHAFERDDDLLDIEAHLRDTKPFDTPLHAGVRSAGQPIHDMWLRLTINASFDVLAVDACTDAVPYPGYCDTIAAAYQRLVGANLLKGFRAVVKAELGNTLGCTHLSELSWVLPTTAVQAMAGKRREKADRDPQTRPFQIDRCHALASDGPAVARFYPKWHRNNSSGQAIK